MDASRKLWTAGIQAGVIGVLISLACTAGDVPARIDEITHISRQDLALYLRWVNASPEQALIAEALYEQYRQGVEDELRDDLRAYYAKESEVSGQIWAQDVDRGRLARELYPDLWKERDALRERLNVHNAALLEDIAAVLEPSQVDNMARVHTGRARLVLMRRVYLFADGHVDLVALIDRLGLPDDVQKGLWSAFLEQYERSLIDLLQQAYDAQRKRRIDYWEIYDLQYQRGELIRSESAPSLSQWDLTGKIAELEERASRRSIRANERIIEFNRRSLPEILSLVPAESAPLLQDFYNETSYPELYPDPSSAQTLYDVVESWEDLSADQRETLALYRQRYERGHDFATERMAEAIYHRHWSVYAGKPSKAGNIGELWIELRALGEEREQLNEDQIRMITRILLPEQASRLPEWDFTKNPQPRPWDISYERKRARQEKERERQEKERERQEKDG